MGGVLRKNKLTREEVEDYGFNKKMIKNMDLRRKKCGISNVIATVRLTTQTTGGSLRCTTPRNGLFAAPSTSGPRDTIADRKAERRSMNSGPKSRKEIDGLFKAERGRWVFLGCSRRKEGCSIERFRQYDSKRKIRPLFKLVYGRVCNPGPQYAGSESGSMTPRYVLVSFPRQQSSIIYSECTHDSSAIIVTNQ